MSLRPPWLAEDEPPNAFTQLLETMLRRAERYVDQLEALVDELRAEQANAIAPKLKGRRR